MLACHQSLRVPAEVLNRHQSREFRKVKRGSPGFTLQLFAVCEFHYCQPAKEV